jgi:hypothetical protein
LRTPADDCCCWNAPLIRIRFFFFTFVFMDTFYRASDENKLNDG